MIFGENSRMSRLLHEGRSMMCVCVRVCLCVRECAGAVFMFVVVCVCVCVCRVTSLSRAPNTLQHTVAHCNTQHTAHCNKLQHTATHGNILQHTATPYSTLQHPAKHYNTLQHTATPAFSPAPCGFSRGVTAVCWYFAPQTAEWQRPNGLVTWELGGSASMEVSPNYPPPRFPPAIVYECVYIYRYTCMYIYKSVYRWINIYMFVYVYIYIDKKTHIYICFCIYTYIYL